jgi:hypothetical protein
MDDARIYGEALSAAKSYADAILLKPLGELGGILSDTIGYWRLKNQVRLMLRAKEWLEDLGVEPTRLRPDIFVPLLEHGGNTEDETLADMFASLLASHLDADRQDFVHPSFGYVLSQLSPRDAKLMIEFRRLASDAQYREMGFRGGTIVVQRIAELLECNERLAYISAINLERLGITYWTGFRPPADHPLPEVFEDSQAHQEYRITEYGVAFCDECCAGNPAVLHRSFGHGE